MCYVNITFKSENEDDLKTLHKLFLKAKNHENYNAKEICKELKIDFEDNYDLGSIYDVSVGVSYCFEIEIENKRDSKMDLFDAIIRPFKDMSYIYTLEEPECGIYINSDVDGEFYSNRFKLDISDFDKEEFPELPKALQFLDLNKSLYSEGSVVDYFSREKLLLKECKDLFRRYFASFEDVKSFCESLSKVSGEHINVYMFQHSE